MERKIPAYLHFILRVYLLAILVSAVFRLILLLAVNASWELDGEFSLLLTFQAFVVGLRFDTVIIGYVLVVPYGVLGLLSLFNGQPRWLYRTFLIFIGVLYAGIFFILSADIPFFIQFFSHLSVSAFLWSDYPEYSIEMVLKEPKFWMYLIPFFLSLFLLWRLGMREWKRSIPQSTSIRLPIRLLIFVLFAGLILLGMRGSLDKKATIKEGTAYFCEDPFLNKLGLNPVFAFAHSAMRAANPKNLRLNLMEDELALHEAKRWLGITTGGQEGLQRPVDFGAGLLHKANVVVVIMESMGSYKMGAYGGPAQLTPNLHALEKKSIHFSNIYTAGIHTYNGLYSSLYSLPALKRQHPLEAWLQVPHYSLPKILRERGYQTAYFTTHSDQFDNAGGFLRANGFSKVYSNSSYPSELDQGPNGVADHYMFEYAIERINEMAEAPDPFFCALLTSSDHRPYIIPTGIDFKPTSSKEHDQIVEYADWSVGRFMSAAKKQQWFENTLFVFVADHGLSVGHTYDMPLSYHRSPLLFYCQKLEQNAADYDGLGGQIDIGPTVLGLLGEKYVNTTLGVDLLHETRPYMYFCADDRIGCIDREYYYINRDDNTESLYKYKNLSTEDYKKLEPGKLDSMKSYAFSMMQSTQWLVERKLLSKKTVE